MLKQKPDHEQSAVTTYYSKSHVKLQHTWFAGTYNENVFFWRFGCKKDKSVKNLRKQRKERRSGWGRKQPSFILGVILDTDDVSVRIFSPSSAARSHPDPGQRHRWRPTAGECPRRTLCDVTVSPGAAAPITQEQTHTADKASTLVLLLPVKPSLHNVIHLFFIQKRLQRLRWFKMAAWRSAAQSVSGWPSACWTAVSLGCFTTHKRFKKIYWMIKFKSEVRTRQ